MRLADHIVPNQASPGTPFGTCTAHLRLLLRALALNVSSDGPQQGRDGETGCMTSLSSAMTRNNAIPTLLPHPGHSRPSGYAILTTAASYMPTAWTNGCVPTTLRVRPASLNLTATAVRSSYTTPSDAARPPWEDPPALAVAHGSPLRARGTIASGNQRPVSPPLGGMRDPMTSTIGSFGPFSQPSA